MDAESLAQVEQIVGRATTRLEDKIEEAKRHMGVIHEDVLHKLDLVIEGMEFNRQRFADVESKIDRESRETRALIQLSYQQIQQRVENLEHRVQVIEQRLGLSA